MSFSPTPQPRTMPLLGNLADIDSHGPAQFHGFLQERAIRKKQDERVGKTLLFFGVAHRDIDRIYREELRDWEAAGVVDVRMSYSREPEGEVRYVQHCLWQDRAEATVFL